jgi:hypothetical protein
MIMKKWRAYTEGMHAAQWHAKFEFCFLDTLYSGTPINGHISSVPMTSLIKYYYHSLYSILNFDWLIYLQITACK